MKVLAQAANNKFICEVDQYELQKHLNIYYDKDPKRNMKVGDVIDLGVGYDYAQKITDALDQTRKFIGNHTHIIDYMTKGFLVEARYNEAENACVELFTRFPNGCELGDPTLEKMWQLGKRIAERYWPEVPD